MSFSDDGDQHVDGHGDPYLGFHRVLGGAEEGLDAETLLDPLEEQFHPPAVPVEFGDGRCGNGEVVGQEVEAPVGVRVAVPDAAQRLGVLGSGLLPGQQDGLVAAQARGLVQRPRVAAPVLGVGLGPRDEERARLRDERVQDADIVRPGLGNMHERGDAAANAHVVELVVLRAQAHLDVAQALAESQLGERHAQELVEAGEGLHPVVAAVAPHAAAKGLRRQVVHELREHESARMHGGIP